VVKLTVWKGDAKEKPFCSRGVNPKGRFMEKIPKEWQGVLWAKNYRQLDLNKDKAYIIHHVLSYGDLSDIKLLFRIYGQEEVKDVFLKQPIKIYDRPCLHFIKEFILNLKEPINEEKYLKTAPRNLAAS